MSRAWSPQSQAGDFACSRRGGLTSLQCAEIRAERSKPRPTPWTALAKRYGRCELDIRAVVAPPEKTTTPDPEQPRAATGRRPRIWTEDQLKILLEAERGEVPVRAAARLLDCERIVVRSWIERRARFQTVGLAA